MPLRNVCQLLGACAVLEASAVVLTRFDHYSAVFEVDSVCSAVVIFRGILCFAWFFILYCFGLQYLHMRMYGNPKKTLSRRGWSLYVDDGLASSGSFLLIGNIHLGGLPLAWYWLPLARGFETARC